MPLRAWAELALYKQMEMIPIPYLFLFYAHMNMYETIFVFSSHPSLKCNNWFLTILAWHLLAGYRIAPRQSRYTPSIPT